MPSEGCEATLVDLRNAYDVVVVRRKDTRDTSERWFGVRSVESFEVGEPSCRTGVRILDVVQVGQVEYMSESMLARDQPCGSGATKSSRSPGKGKFKRSATPAPLLHPRNYFNLTTSQLSCPKEEECTLKTQVLQLPRKTKIKLFPRAEVAVFVVLRQFLSQVPEN